MVTTDKEMCRLHCNIIKQHPNITILATAHNGLCLPHEWVAGIIKLKTELERMRKKTPRPWFATFSRDGKITSLKKF